MLQPVSPPKNIKASRMIIDKLFSQHNVLLSPMICFKIISRLTPLTTHTLREMTSVPLATSVQTAPTTHSPVHEAPSPT